MTKPALKRSAAITAATFTAAALTFAPAQAEPTNSGNPLDQTVSDSEATSPDQVLFNSGHMDMGPRVVAGKWRLQIRDDSAKKPVWRDMDNTVVTVKDNALLKVPNNSKYNFIGEKPGTKVWVLPQAEKAGIPWPGWNTQHPGALKAMTKGANFTLDRVSGPGSLIMFLENGALENPQVLWDSKKKERQNVFAEANSHTHANWVFTKPGIYFVQVTSSATTKSGKMVKDTEILRFAVGTATDPMPGFATKPFDGETAAPDEDSLWTKPWVWAAGAGIVAVAVGFAAASRRRKPGRSDDDRLSTSSTEIHEAGEPIPGSSSSNAGTQA